MRTLCSAIAYATRVKRNFSLIFVVRIGSTHENSNDHDEDSRYLADTWTRSPRAL